MSELDPGKLGDELMATIAALRRLVRRRLRGALTERPLRGAHIELLRVVQQEPDISVAAAARSLRLAANSVSTLVNQLTDAGMLLRHADPDDRRAARLRLTDRAAERLAAWRRARSELVGAGVAELSAADQDAIAKALPALRLLLDNLDSDETGEAS